MKKSSPLGRERLPCEEDFFQEGICLSLSLSVEKLLYLKVLGNVYVVFPLRSVSLHSF